MDDVTNDPCGLAVIDLRPRFGLAARTLRALDRPGDASPSKLPLGDSALPVNSCSAAVVLGRHPRALMDKVEAYRPVTSCVGQRELR